jgi:hypothetical protein
MSKIWGILAEYHDPESLMEAAKKARDAGYTRLDAFTPFPVHGLNEALGQKPTRIQWLILAGGIAGGVGGFFMQWYANVVSWPWNVGGRPLNSWPSWMPVTFELTVLLAAFTAVIGMFVLNGLPQPYHPVFNVKAFDNASRDKFFLCVPASDPKFSADQTKIFLRNLNPLAVHDVEE